MAIDIASPCPEFKGSQGKRVGGPQTDQGKLMTGFPWRCTLDNLEAVGRARNDGIRFVEVDSYVFLAGLAALVSTD